jgi:hypothetical protein
MRTTKILALGAVSAIGVGLGCATVIGLDPAQTSACTDPTNQTALGQDQAGFLGNVVACAATNKEDLGRTSACIQGQDGGLSTQCADCFAVNGVCALTSCGMECGVHGADNAQCQTCVDLKCNDGLVMCGGTPIYACIDPNNAMALMEHMASIEMDSRMCGIMLTTNPDVDAVASCIEMMDRLSHPCALCYAQMDVCAVNHCKVCVYNPMDPACNECVIGACNATFALCSGIQQDAGVPDTGGPD